MTERYSELQEFAYPQQVERAYNHFSAKQVYDLHVVGRSMRGQEIIDMLLDDLSLERLIVAGPPGSGKTTIRKESEKELAHLGGLKLFGELYEDAEAMTTIALGGRGAEEWSQEDWRDVNKNMIAIQESIPNIAVRNGERVLRVMETVGVGKTDERDRGVTALNNLDISHSLVLFMAPDPRCQKRAVQVRTLGSQQSDEDVEMYIMGKFNIFPVAAPGSRFDRADGRERGRIIKGLFTHMAQRDHISKINSETLELAIDLFTRDEDIRRILDTELPPELSDQLSASDQFWLKLDINYMEKRLHELGVPNEQGLIVINEFNPKERVFWFIDDSEVEALEKAA